MQQGGNEVWHLVQEEPSSFGGSLGWDNLSHVSGTRQPKLMAEENKQTSLSVVSGSSDSCFPDSASLSSKETEKEDFLAGERLDKLMSRYRATGPGSQSH